MAGAAPDNDPLGPVPDGRGHGRLGAMERTVRLPPSRALLPLTGLLVAACAAAPPPATPAWTIAPTSAPSASSAIPASAIPATRAVVTVYKSPTCSCCHEWEAYLRAAGYRVESIPTEDMATVKARFGLPEATWSCHTAVIEGYAVEGHIPVAAIEDLLAARPAIDGIALPGMPAGSPGMAGVQATPFQILAIDDGATSEFGSY